MGDQTALEKADLVVRGERSELHVRDGVITLHKDATTQRTPTEITFGVDQVRAVTLNAPSRGGRGWLHIAVVGGSPPPPSELAATGDPYTLPLVSRSAGAAKKLAKLIDRHVQERGKPPDKPTTPRLSSGVVLNPIGEPTPKRPFSNSPAAQAPPRPASSTPSAPAPPRSASVSTPTSPPEDAEGVDADALITQLTRLAKLHKSGALTDDEFTKAKAKLLD